MIEIRYSGQYNLDISGTELDSSACAKGDRGEGINGQTAMNQYLQKFQAV